MRENTDLIPIIYGMKDFHKWNETKIKIDSRNNFKHPKAREVWWCSVGLNVGSEIFGKGEIYARPVIIINSELGQSFIGIPLTSKVKTGKYCCVVQVTKDKISTALVSQIRNLDKRRLIKKIGILSGEDYQNVIQILKNIHKI